VATTEETAICSALGEKISAQEIAGAAVIGSAPLLIDGRVLKLIWRKVVDS
jgi:hypothetical protein